MPSSRISSDLNSGTYYLTLTTQHWYNLFDRHNRWGILADSFRFGWMTTRQKKSRITGFTCRS